VENEEGRVMESRIAALGVSSKSAMTCEGAKSGTSFRNTASYNGLVLRDMVAKSTGKAPSEC